MAQAIKHIAVGIMDLRNNFSRKRSRNEESCDQEELAKVDSASKGQALDDAPEEASVKSKAQKMVKGNDIKIKTVYGLQEQNKLIEIYNLILGTR